ncbi:MAG: hypothetical protein M5U34_48035 [Chloroflexi bacterium]|nr:hypothetical protein [Chloroflexota bacterium]
MTTAVSGYYGLVTDLQLGATDPRFADEKTDRMLPAIQQALLGKTLYTTLEMYPTLLMDRGPELTDPERATWEALRERGEFSPAPSRSKPCRLITPMCARPTKQTWPKSSAKKGRVSSTSAIPSNRGTKCAWTSTNSSNAPAASLAPPGRARAS